MIPYKKGSLLLCILCVGATLLFSSCSEKSSVSNNKKETVDFNAAWESGLSAAAPFEGAEPRDLTTHIGYIQPYPNQVEVAMGMDQIYIVLPRTDVSGGSGHLTLFQDDTASEIQQIAFDSPAVQFLSMTEQELSDMGWELGTKICITFDKFLGPGSYTIQMEEGCILAPDFSVKSPAYTDAFKFQVAEYGLAGIEPSSGDPYHAKVGDTTTLYTTLNQDAVKTDLQITPENAASFEYLENGTYRITFTQTGEVMYSLFFYNEQGEELGILDHIVTVAK